MLIIVSVILVFTKEKKEKKVSPKRKAEITSALHILNQTNTISVCSTRRALCLELCCSILSASAPCWQQVRNLRGKKKQFLLFKLLEGATLHRRTKISPVSIIAGIKIKVDENLSK